MGNGTQYERITAAKDVLLLLDSYCPKNGWHVVMVGGHVGWVSEKYVKLT